MAWVRTSFNPPVNGFRFINRFEFPFLSQFNILVVRPIPLGDLVYGLCGGMCFAALDYYYSAKPVPTFTDVDDISLKLFAYLWDRQLDSLRLSVIQELFKCMMLDDRSLARSMSSSESKKITNMLDQGNPAPLVLVRVRGIMNPTHNHQVLATGYDLDPATNDLSIELYDPNHPLQTPTLKMNLSRPNQGIQLIESTGEPLRGFFVIDYERQPAP